MSWTAASLLQRFAVYGRFYRASFGPRTFELRSHLEIFAAGATLPNVANADADLVVVMMNPGASRPTEAPDSNGWAPAIPDRTQYQIMKLASHAQSRGIPMRHVRVLNLSDLRTPRSAELFAIMATLRDDTHSLFSAQRRGELLRALGSPSVPVLRAWGLAAQMKGLAGTCVALTSSRKVLGLTDNGLQYRHPLPQRADLQKVWLEQLCTQVEQWP